MYEAVSILVFFFGNIFLYCQWSFYIDPTFTAESLKNYPLLATASKVQMQKMQEMEQLANVQGLPTDRNTLNKLMALNPGLNNHINNPHNMVNRGALSGSAQAALALNNYQNLLMRQNSMNSSPGSLQREGSSFNNSNQSPSSALQGAGPALIPGPMQNSSVSGFPSPRLPPQQQATAAHDSHRWSWVVEKEVLGFGWHLERRR